MRAMLLPASIFCVAVFAQVPPQAPVETLPVEVLPAEAASGVADQTDSLAADSAGRISTGAALEGGTLAADSVRAASPEDPVPQPPVPPAPAPIAAQPASGEEADTESGLELDEKTVKGRSTGAHREKEVSRIRIGREALQKVAASQGDPFKVLSTLPGVTNQNDMSVRPFVRGGKAEETQVLWEGIPLLQPYHFASVYSIFNMESLEDMTLYSGGFPASVGNALSGAILMRSRPAPLDSFRLYTDASILRGLGHVGIPIVKGRLGASYSYQAFWYDWAIDRTWDVLDFFAGDSAFSAEKKKFRSYLDLPNFRDHQFGLNWKGGDGLAAQYTGIVSRDVFTVRNTKSRFYVNGGEVSPEYYERNFFYGNPTDRRQRLSSWDSLAVVSVDNFVHGVSFHWEPKDRWKVDQSVAWQSQDWHVSFFDKEIWTDSVAPDGGFAGFRRPGPSQLLFKLNNQTVDYRLDAHYDGEKHQVETGLSQSIRSSRYHTKLQKPIYDIIVNGSVDALDALGFFDPNGFAITKTTPLTDPTTNYLQHLPDLIRFDHQGNRKGNFIGAYVSDQWSLDARHRLTTGLRLETDSYAQDLFLSPRLAWFQAMGAKDELTLATGLYSQADFPFHIRAANPGLRSEKAFHFNAEWTHAFSKAYRLEIQAYQKNYYDLVVPVTVNTGKLNWDSGVLSRIDSAEFNALSPADKQLVIDLFGERRLDYENGGLGKASGAEVSFFYDPNKVWNGWVSAEVGYSRRLDQPGQRPYDFRQSRPWAFNWVNYFHMPSNYELALRARFASGLPYTDYSSLDFGDGGVGGGFGNGNPWNSESDTLFQVGPRNGKRYAPYSRWDLRLTKDFHIRKHAMQSYFEIWNAFNTPNFIMSDSRTGNWKFVDLNYPIPILFLGLNYRW